MKATFEHSIDVLVKAFMNNTLEHNNCCACAVGNLVADGIGIKVVPFKGIVTKAKWESENDSVSIEKGWPLVFMTDDKKQKKRSYNYKDLAKKQIDSTGYTWQDLAKIEFAFETADKGNSDDDWMFNGLMAVVDVLAEIHGIDLEKKEEAKSMFKKTLIGEELEPKKA